MTSPCNIHFSKIIPRTSLANGILKLPGNFTKKCGDGMSNPVFLNLPDSTEWKIHWTKHDGEIWFQEGWKEFAARYSLDHGHLLLFEYVGTSRFDVHIFDESAVEIDYRSHFTHDNPDDSVETLDEQCHDHGTDNIVHISDDSEENLDEQFIRKTGVKNTQSPSQPCKKMKNSIITDAGRSPNGVNLHQHDQSRSAGFQKPKFTKQKLDGEKGKGIFHDECPKVEQLTSSVLNRATTSKSMHPSFKLVMRRSFINSDSLVIPSEFSEQYLKKTHAVILLEITDGRSWPVIFSTPRIIAGWKKFVSENNLRVNDVCVFELITKIQSMAFKVSIIPSAGKPSRLISHDHSKSRKVHPPSNSRGGSSGQRTLGVESDLKLKFLVGKGLLEARKFTSENPFFMTTLKWQGNTTRCPRVPCNFARKYLVRVDRDWIMMQFRNILWPVTVVLAKCDLSGTLSAGWPMFSRANKLQAGDVCIFELVNREDIILDVHVFRDHI